MRKASRMDVMAPHFPELQDGMPFAGTCWRGSRHADESFLLHDPKMPGIFFSSDPRYAAGFGDFVHECAIMLENPHIARESRNDSVPSRAWLDEAGHDGLIMVFENDYFVVATDKAQVRPIGVTHKDCIFEDGNDDGRLPTP